MQIKVRGNHFEVTEALHDYATKKIGRLEKFFHAPAETVAHVTLAAPKRELHSVEVTLPLNGYVIRAEDKSPDMYHSIDVCSDKLEKQIAKHKSKLAKRLKQDGIETLFKEQVGAPATPLPDEAVVATAEVEEVVRVKRFAVKPMDVEEAVMQMDLLGHDFYVFSNSETETVNVVYKRKDGAYGLIEPTFS
jgi:putative sigma-54 modulation protein